MGMFLFFSLSILSAQEIVSSNKKLFLVLLLKKIMAHILGH